MTMTFELSKENRETVVTELEKLLADTYTLYLMSHNFHWNVTGPEFYHYHLLFEEHYTELATAIDVIAERIRTLGFPAPATYKEFSRLTSIKEPEGIPPAREMISIALQNHKIVAKQAKRVIDISEKVKDDGSMDIGTQRISIHEKIIWMLNSIQG